MKQIILMADIIGSRLKDQERLMLDFKALVETVNNDFQDALISPLTITIGDEFQGIIRSVSDATRIIVFMEEELIHKNRDFSLRYVLNEGAVDTAINTTRAFEMLGDGLTTARYRLGQLKDGDERFWISIEKEALSELLQQAFVVYASIKDKWRPDMDYQLVSHFLIHSDYKIVAELLQKNRSLIWKREKSLNLEAYYAIKRIIDLSVKI
jgi:hypothetical protein